MLLLLLDGPILNHVLRDHLSSTRVLVDGDDELGARGLL